MTLNRKFTSFAAQHYITFIYFCCVIWKQYNNLNGDMYSALLQISSFLNKCRKCIINFILQNSKAVTKLILTFLSNMLKF